MEGVRQWPVVWHLRSCSEWGRTYFVDDHQAGQAVGMVAGMVTRERLNRGVAGAGPVAHTTGGGKEKVGERASDSVRVRSLAGCALDRWRKWVARESLSWSVAEAWPVAHSTGGENGGERASESVRGRSSAGCALDWWRKKRSVAGERLKRRAAGAWPVAHSRSGQTKKGWWRERV